MNKKKVKILKLKSTTIATLSHESIKEVYGGATRDIICFTKQPVNWCDTYGQNCA